MSPVFRLSAVALIFCIPGWVRALAADDSIASIDKAFKSGKEAWSSVHLVGEHRVTKHPDSGPYEIDFELYCSGDRQRLALHYGPTASIRFVDFPRSRHVFLCDSKTCLLSSFSTRIRPTGCETRVYRNLIAAISSQGAALRCRLDPSEWFPSTLGKISEDEYHVIEKADGLVWLKSAKKPNLSIELGADPKVGSNIVQLKIAWSGVTHISRKVDWMPHGSGWAVKAMTQRVYNGNDLYEEWTTEYATCERVESFPESTFYIASMAIPGRTRIIDGRNGQTKIYDLHTGDIQMSPTAFLNGATAETR